MARRDDVQQLERAAATVSAPRAERVKVERRPRQKRNVVAAWWGIVPSAPLDHAGVGGVAFVKTLNPTVEDTSGTLIPGAPVLGTVGWLHPDDIASMRSRLPHLWVRRTPSGGAAVVDDASMGFVEDDSDEPLARFMYLYLFDRNDGESDDDLMARVRAHRALVAQDPGRIETLHAGGTRDGDA